MTKEIIVKILDLLYTSCVAEGGDGDALWYSRLYSLDEILPILTEYNSQLKFPFEIHVKDDGIHWGSNQEWIIITADINVYRNDSSWTILVIKY